MRWSDCLKPQLYFSNVVAIQRLHQNYWSGHKTPQLFVSIGHNVWQVTKRLFMNGGHHNMVRLSQTRLIFFKCYDHPENSKKLLGWPQDTTVLYILRPQFLQVTKIYSWMEATTRWPDCIKPVLYFSNVVATHPLHNTFWGEHKTSQLFVAITVKFL